jgi:hypothetical protein
MMLRNVFAVCFALALFAQKGQVTPPAPGQEPEVTLANGKSQREEILRLDHKKNLQDAAAMAKLAEQVSEEFEKDDRFVVSLKTLKNLDEIERLTKTIRGRLKKY